MIGKDKQIEALRMQIYNYEVSTMALEKSLEHLVVSNAEILAKVCVVVGTLRNRCKNTSQL